MNKLAVIYWSGTGHTEAMAALVADGARSAGAEVDLFTAAQFDAGSVDGYTALALGCPAMGAEQLEESEFEPMYQAVRGRLAGRTVGLFGSYGWGDGEWMRSWAEDARAAGAEVPEPVTANEAPDGEAADACTALGRRLAGG